jgi:SAM-dependent methyltransferase
MAPKPAASPQQEKPLQRQRLTEYPGKDLDAMAFASNYRRWIMDLLKPFIGRHIVEVGAGTGAFSELLLATKPESLTILEPSSNLYRRLADLLRPLDSSGVVQLRHMDFIDAYSNPPHPQPPDTAVYINVLEHIEDDEAELDAVFATLPPGGRILIFVPALPYLMSDMDRELGHFRRYTLKDLKSKCAAAGFNIQLARYFDAFGVLPWWLKYRVLKSKRLEPGEVRFHDRFIVPVSRLIDGIVTLPCGKNILLVAEKRV